MCIAPHEFLTNDNLLFCEVLEMLQFLQAQALRVKTSIWEDNTENMALRYHTPHNDCADTMHSS